MFICLDPSRLPEPLARSIDWKTFAAARASFVTRALGERHTDELFTARLRDGGAVVYLLVEHQSRVETTMPLRLLRYMVQIWDSHREGQRRSRCLPGIVPVVVHNGPRGWRRSPAFRALYELPADAQTALMPHLVDFAFVLYDLGRTDDGDLVARATPVEGMMLHCLRHYRAPKRLLEGLEHWVRVLCAVETAENARAALEVATEYISEVSRGSDRGVLEKLRGLVAEVLEEDIVVSIADRLRREGRVEGRLEGRAEGRIEGERSLLIRQLRIMFGRVSRTLTRRINAADVRTVRRWFDRSVTARRVGEVVRAR